MGERTPKVYVVYVHNGELFHYEFLDVLSAQRFIKKYRIVSYTVIYGHSVNIEE